MNKNFILATIIAFSLMSCSKHNDPQPPPIKEYFRGKWNGSSFTADTPLLYQQASPMGSTETRISGSTSWQGITLALTDLATGERLLNQANPNDFITLYTSRPPENFKAGLLRGSYQGSGKINILEITSRYIRGTFECIAPEDSSLPFVYYGPAHFIEGEFNIKRP